MSAPQPPLRSRRAARATPRVGWGVDIVGVTMLAALGLVAAWPIYQDPWLIVTTTAGAAAATCIAIVAALRRWPWWLVAGVTTVTYLLLAIPLAAPRALSDLAGLPAALVHVTTAPVTGWKNLLTLDLPVGTYQAVLAPWFLLCLVVPVVALSIAWRTSRWIFAIPLSALLPLFGTIFGSSAVRGLLTLGPITVPGTVEIAVGVATLASAIGWYVWRSRAVRRAQLDSARRVVRRTGSTRSRPGASVWLLGATMAVLSIGIGTAAAPWAVLGAVREVPRTAIDPTLRVQAELSPLSTYRAFFDDDLYDQALFQVTTGSSSDRVRLATLSFYDGVIARVLDPAGADPQATSFVRLPASAATADTAFTTTVTIGTYDLIWVPIVGELTSISFAGAQRAALADGFYVNAHIDTGIEISEPGLVSGVTMTQTAVSETSTGEPQKGTPQLPASLVPESLTQWYESQNVTADFDGLLTLVERLRARGYLSHALTVDTAAPPAWMADLGDYTFEPSRAGHSTDRIGEMFSALLDRQNEVGDASDSELVAAVGDDEQFAVAAAILADQLGFDARVVWGARLSSAEGLRSCTAGICRGKDMAAWIEVRDSDGGWIPVDVTPQHSNPVAPQVDQRNDPLIPTEVQPEQAEEVAPPDAAPADSSSEEPPTPETEQDLTAVWAAVRLGLISLAVVLALLGPFLVVVAAKAHRRRTRRRARRSADRVTGGWDEYVDTAVDRGLPRPGAATRSETAVLYDTRGIGAASALATWADRSAFAADAPSDADSAAFWQLVETERRRLLRELPWWQRWRARVSLRSLRRSGSARTSPASGGDGGSSRGDDRTTKMTRSVSGREDAR